MDRFIRPIHFQIGILFIIFVGLYFPFILTMVQDWNTNENFSHGYFIPAISVFMLLSMRRKLKDVEIFPSNWGFALIILGLMQLTVGKIGSEYFLQRTSIILVLFGLCLFILGKHFTKMISVPILYLIFMIPIPAILWNEIAFPMQLFSSDLAEAAIRTLGISVLREGNILQLSNTSLEVVDACSGLRSLMSMLALSAAIAYLYSSSKRNKWIVFLSAIPIAILINILRLTFTAVIAEQFGDRTAHGFLHGFSGWLMFTLGLAMLIGIHLLLSKGKIRDVQN